MEDLTLDSQQHNSTKADKQRGTLRRKLKKSKQNKEDGDASNDKDTKQEKEKHSKQHTKKDKKDKREKQRLSASVFSKNSSPSTSGSTGVGLSTHEFSYNASHQSAPHDDDDDASASSLGSSARTASPLTASSPPKLGSHISRSGAQFASSPELFASSSATPSKGSSSKGKEKKSHSSAAFEAIEPRQLHAKDRVQHAAAASSGDLVTRGRSNSECVIEGFLEEALLKRMGGTHTRRVSKWRKRWARLYRCDAGTFLLTHDKPPASGKKAAVRSRVDVLAMVKVEKRDDIRRCAFVLMPDDCDRESPVYFCTDTEVERTSWMAAISRMQQQEMTDIVQPLRSRQSMAARAETELRPGMTTLNLDDLEEDKRRKHMVLINGEERKPLDIKEEQDQSDSIVEGIEEDSEEARMMRDIERRVQELSAQQPQPPHNLPSAPALSMSTMPSYYHAHSHPHQPLQMVQQHQHQHQQQVLLRQQSYMAVGAHQQPGSTLSGSYNPFIEIPANVAGAPAMPLPQQHHLQHQNSPYYMQPPVRRGSFVATDLSNSFSSLPQAQTVVMSTLSAATSPSTSTSIASISPHGTPPSGMSALPSPHIPPPFMRQSSSIHMAHHAHHALLSSAPSAVAQS